MSTSQARPDDRLDHIGNHELGPTLRILSDAGATVGDAAWLRSPGNARKFLELLRQAQGQILTLADMIRACGLDQKNVTPGTTEERFPVRPERFTAEGSRIFCFGCELSTAEARRRMSDQGYEPDPIEKLLAYGKEHPDQQRLYRIIALGSCWVKEPYYSYPCLYADKIGRRLDYTWEDPESGWGISDAFLASPKKPV
jgi:hypothetical protein